MDNKLFVKVRCRAYMKMAKDGVFIVMYNPDGTVCEDRLMKSYKGKAVAMKRNFENGDDIEVEDLSEFCGQCVVVGYTTIKANGLMGTDWNDSTYGGDFGYCFKNTTWAPKVAVVYFKNNCKRYVLLEDMEVLDGV